MYHCFERGVPLADQALSDKVHVDQGSCRWKRLFQFLVICPFEQYLKYSFGRHAENPIKDALLVVGGIQQRILDVSDGKALAYICAKLATFGSWPCEDDATVSGTDGTA
jgi:hypothetical protein